MQPQPAIFEAHEIRRVYDETTETWLFSVIDIVQVLTQSSDYQTARKYWKVLKSRLDKEGCQLVTNCYQLKIAADEMPGIQHCHLPPLVTGGLASEQPFRNRMCFAVMAHALAHHRLPPSRPPSSGIRIALSSPAHTPGAPITSAANLRAKRNICAVLR